MRIAIYGAGSIGGVMAGFLAESGQEVCAIARGAHQAAIAEHGLRLRKGPQERLIRIPCSSRASDFGPQDVVILSVKGTGLAAAADDLAPLLGPDTPVVFAMNGIPPWYATGSPAEDRFRPALDAIYPSPAVRTLVEQGRAIGCIVSSGAEVEAPGAVRNTTPTRNKLVIGEPDGRVSARCERLGSAFRAAGYDVTVSSRIRRDLWVKLLGTVSISPLSALTVNTNRSLCEQPDLQDLTRRLMAECVALAAAVGHPIDVDIEQRVNPEVLPHHKPSMLQDMERSREIEIDTTLVAVQAVARCAGADTPLMDVVFALLKGRARSLGLYPG